MKKEISITYIEISKWLEENKNLLINSFIKKIKQKDNIFYFKLYNKKTLHLFVYLPYFLFFSNYSIRIEKPTNFQLVLRKYAENTRIINVFQKEFDKIVVFELSNQNKIIFEFFSEGNIIIVNKENKIIDALIKREWKDRKIDRDVEYVYPPNKNILRKSITEIFNVFQSEAKPLVKILMDYFGLNLAYSQKILKILNLENKNSNEISQKDVDSILRLIEEILQSKKYYLEISDIIWIGSLSDKNLKEFSNINEAFLEAYNLNEKKRYELKKKEEEAKKQKILFQIEATKQETIKQIEEISKKIEVLQKNYYLIDEICRKILELRKLNVDWNDIKNIIKKQYKEVIDIEESKSLIKLSIENATLEVDFRDLRKYLNDLFEKRKKLKEKLEKISKTQIQEIKVAEEKKEVKVEEQKEQKQWYEKFRWFISSDGYLVVSGKDAETNEELIRKYVRDFDLVLHADIHGSPFTVIRNDKKQAIPPQTIYEAAQFTACYSQAWDLGLGTIHVYYVSPNQLVKANLPKGSFLIKGERNWLEKVKLRLSIGVYEEKGKIKVFAAPPVAARKLTQYIITLVPGNRSADELVKEIRRHFESILPFELRSMFEKIDDEEIKRLIPFGKGELVKA
ncbi:MAG: ribosome rescue protein RqcH [Candidatus Aenigmatarchaeota archaeon]